MQTVLLIDDNEANQLIARTNLDYVDKEMNFASVRCYEKALDWIKNNDTPAAIIANNHIWSSSHNVMTFLKNLKKSKVTASIPIFISALSVKQDQQVELLNYDNMVCVLEKPISVVDTAIVVNHLKRKNHTDMMLFAS